MKIGDKVKVGGQAHSLEGKIGAVVRVFGEFIEVKCPTGRVALSPSLVQLLPLEVGDRVVGVTCDRSCVSWDGTSGFVNRIGSTFIEVKLDNGQKALFFPDEVSFIPFEKPDIRVGDLVEFVHQGQSYCLAVTQVKDDCFILRIDGCAIWAEEVIPLTIKDIPDHPYTRENGILVYDDFAKMIKNFKKLRAEFEKTYNSEPERFTSRYNAARKFANAEYECSVEAYTDFLKEISKQMTKDEKDWCGVAASVICQEVGL